MMSVIGIEWLDVNPKDILSDKFLRDGDVTKHVNTGVEV